jgi:hypothetical protein
VYNIEGTTYYIPNYGFQIKIWDFGRCVLLNDDPETKVAHTMVSNIKRFFDENEYLDYISDISDNIHKGLNKKNNKNFVDLYSAFDVYRITDSVSVKINGYRTKEWNMLQTTVDLIVNDTIDDYIVKLGTDITEKSEGCPTKIIAAYFEEYTKKPEGNILATF